MNKKMDLAAQAHDLVEDTPQYAKFAAMKTNQLTNELWIQYNEEARAGDVEALTETMGIIQRLSDKLRGR